MGVKQLLVVVHQDTPEIVPQVLDGVEVLPEGPLGLLFRQLPEQVLLHAFFRFIGSHKVSPLYKQILQQEFFYCLETFQIILVKGDEGI